MAFLRSLVLAGAFAFAASCCGASEEPLSIGRVQQPPNIDGDLSDWLTPVSSILLGEAGHTLPRPGQWKGARDLSGAVWLAWDDTWLYLAAEVADDALMQAAPEGAEPWQGDSLEIFFNAEPGRQDTSCFRQVALVPPLQPDARFAVVCPQGEFSGVEAQARPHAGGYTFEARIPWKNLQPFQPKAGAQVGFQVMLDDRDRKGRKSQLCWYPSAATYSRPLEMGVLRLDENAAASRDLIAAGPAAAVVTDATKMDVSIATILPGARRGRVSLLEPRAESGRKIGPVELALESVAGKLSAGDAPFPVEGLEGKAKFGVEIFGANGEALGSMEFVTELAGKRYAEIRQNIQNLEARLAAVPEAAEEARREQRAGVSFWLQRAKALAANEARPEAVTPALLEALRGEIREVAGAVEILEKGGDPYAGRTGSFVRAYRSPLTGAFRPHALFVPPGYDPAKPPPMIVVLHGVFGDERHLFQMLPAIRGFDAIVYQAASYRQLDWTDLSAAETWAGLDQVLDQYAVDRDRISLIGHHIGGRGVLQLAMAKPGFFSAAAPMYAGVDAKPAYPALALYPDFYEAATANHIPYPVFKKPARPGAAGDIEKEIYERLSLAMRAENLAGLPMRIVTGEHDPDAAAEGLALEKRCQELGMSHPSTYVPGAMHGSRPPQLESSEWYQWLLGQRRNPTPEKFVFVCSNLRENAGWYVRIDGLASPLLPGRLAVNRSDAKLEIETQDVSAFTPVAFTEGLDPSSELTLAIDGQDLGKWRVEKLAGLGFAKTADGSWRRESMAKSGKRHGMSGPIDDFQTDRLLYVYGTGGSPEENARLEKVAKKISNRGLGTEFPCKADVAVTDEELRTCNLVLVGTPSTNRLTARVADGLPLRWEERGLRLGSTLVEGEGVGACLIHPNPLATDRYIVVLSALDEAGYRVWDTRAGVDFTIGKTEGKTFQPTARGVFANDWSLQEKLTYRPTPGP